MACRQCDNSTTVACRQCDNSTMVACHQFDNTMVACPQCDKSTKGICPQCDNNNTTRVTWPLNELCKQSYLNPVQLSNGDDKTLYHNIHCLKCNTLAEFNNDLNKSHLCSMKLPEKQPMYRSEVHFQVNLDLNEGLDNVIIRTTSWKGVWNINFQLQCDLNMSCEEPDCINASMQCTPISCPVGYKALSQECVLDWNLVKVHLFFNKHPSSSPTLPFPYMAKLLITQTYKPVGYIVKLEHKVEAIHQFNITFNVLFTRNTTWEQIDAEMDEAFEKLLDNANQMFEHSPIIRVGYDLHTNQTREPITDIFLTSPEQSTETLTNKLYPRRKDPNDGLNVTHFVKSTGMSYRFSMNIWVVFCSTQWFILL
ncbi:unnamed protein product [Owenia fusiformis]|uniref:Uncharacterized protein n=1 Tax=Owenia fusiformis TaxID=6347 RepID=A0A8S4NIL8_OWEFU|nr:unnamed protein product [Owenia fusiformis]